MSGLLEKYQKTEIRATFDEIIIYEPTQEQLVELEGVLKDVSNINGEGFLPSKQTRYLIKTLTNIDDIDNYTDEELMNKLFNGNIVLERVMWELKTICDEIVERIQHGILQELEMQLNILEANRAMTKTEEHSKKIGFESVQEMVELSNPETPQERKQEILDKINKVKKSRKKKATK